MAEGFLTELRRRNVFKVATVYLIAGWIVLQVIDVVLPALGLPEWSFTLILVLLLIGFPFAMILAWAFEMTPGGIKREEDVDRSESATHSTGRKIDFGIIGLLAVALIAYVVTDIYFDQPGSESSATGGADKSIAVLPFTSMSADPENEYFSDGLSEELLNVLAQIKELKVAGRTSSFYYKGRNEDLRVIGKQLNVGHVLEGSVRKDGNRVRITAQLIDVNDGFHVWSDTYDRELDDIFAIQEEIALAVVAAMKVTLLGEEKVALTERPTQNAQAHSKYLVARTRMRQRGLENLTQSRQLFEQIIKDDPTFAPAYSGLSDAVLLLANNHSAIGIEESREIAEKNGAMALTLAPDSSDAWTSKAFLEYQKFQILGKRQNFDSAEAAYKKAIELSPENSEAHHWYGILLETDRQDERAAKLIQRSLDLDPLARNPRQRLGGILVRGGKLDQARTILEETVTLYPDFGPALAQLGNLELNTGNLERAEHWFERATQTGNNPGTYFSLSSLYADLGDIDKANATLDGLDITSTLGKLAPLLRATFADELGKLHELAEQELARTDDKAFWTGIVIFTALGADEFDRILETGRELSPQLFADTPEVNGVTQGNALAIAYAYKNIGQTDKAEPLISGLIDFLDSTESGFVTNGQHIFRAQLLCLQDDSNKAMDHLDRAYDQGLRSFWNQGFYPLHQDPLLFCLDDEPEFMALIEKIRNDNQQTRQAMAASP